MSGGIVLTTVKVAFHLIFDRIPLSASFSSAVRNWGPFGSIGEHALEIVTRVQRFS